MEDYFKVFLEKMFFNNDDDNDNNKIMYSSPYIICLRTVKVQIVLRDK